MDEFIVTEINQVKKKVLVANQEERAAMARLRSFVQKNIYCTHCLERGHNYCKEISQYDVRWDNVYLDKDVEAMRNEVLERWINKDKTDLNRKNGVMN